MNRGFIDDFLRLAVKGAQPALTGPSKLNFKMRVPPGPGKLASRLELDGTFLLDGATFTSTTVQQKIDDLSRRAQGKPTAAEIQNVPSDFAGTFRMKHSRLDLSKLVFGIPGADVSLQGWYKLNTEELEFRGVVKTSARLSEMAKSRWKRIVLKPVDPYFAKDGAGALFHIAITGTRDDPKFGLDRSKPPKPAERPET